GLGYEYDLFPLGLFCLSLSSLHTTFVSSISPLLRSYQDTGARFLPLYQSTRLPLRIRRQYSIPPFEMTRRRISIAYAEANLPMRPAAVPSFQHAVNLPMRPMDPLMMPAGEFTAGDHHAAVHGHRAGAGNAAAGPQAGANTVVNANINGAANARVGAMARARALTRAAAITRARALACAGTNARCGANVVAPAAVNGNAGASPGVVFDNQYPLNAPLPAANGPDDFRLPLPRTHGQVYSTTITLSDDNKTRVTANYPVAVSKFTRKRTRGEESWSIEFGPAVKAAKTEAPARPAAQ
ncbi:hypothetical protein F4808DRAFT_258666, partial [Astrocystis sublimbata]